jgi:ABC-2 type transport system permease protein
MDELMDVLLDRSKYTEYTGKRRGRAAIVREMIKQEFAYGLRQKSLVVLGAFAVMSSAGVVAILTATGVLGLVTTSQMAFVANLDPSFLTNPTARGLVDNTSAIFVNYFWKNSFFVFLLTLLIANIGSRLIAQDMHDKVLSLYFTRPIKRLDYLLGKLGTIVLLLIILTFVPALIVFAYLLLMSDYLSWSFAGEHLWVVPTLLIQSLVFALSFGSLALLCSSLTPKRMFAAGGFLIINFGSMVTAAIMQELDIFKQSEYISIPYSVQQLCAWFMRTGKLDLGIAPWFIGLIIVVSVAGITVKLSRAQVEG